VRVAQWELDCIQDFASNVAQSPNVLPVDTWDARLRVRLDPALLIDFATARPKNVHRIEFSGIGSFVDCNMKFAKQVYDLAGGTASQRAKATAIEH
jgi:hypothetical protein